ncbi:MAG: amino acid permease [Candidatus Marinimicrobia bacterium]|nr:amino acid permease [Candidatus Neomarinimicrobiota bacterium]
MSLKKTISTFDIFCIASGVMISSGIFILPGIAFGKTGPSVFLSYALAGFAALIGVFSIIELSTAMPKSGGDYYFINRSFGPLPGLITGIFSWFSLSFKTAFAIFGIAEILFTMTGYNLFLLAVAVTLLFVLLNILGIDFAAKFEVIIVVGLLSIMLLYIIAGITQVDILKFNDFAPHGTNAIFLTSGFVFVSFGGLLNVASLSGEVEDPKRSIPRGLISSVIIVTIIYSLLLIVLVGTSEPGKLMGSLTPVADSASSFLGNFGYTIVIIAAFLAFISTANAGIMSASRYPVALGNDNLLPEVFSKTNKRFKTPVFAILLTGVVIIVSLLLELNTLVKIASSIILSSYILTNIAVIIIRESKVQNYQPSFRVPFYPWIQIISVLLFIVLLLEVGMAALETIGVIIAISLVVYFVYGRKGYTKEYALLYLIERIMNKTLTSNDLEDELKEIIHNRDDIVEDRFHRLVNDSFVLDIEAGLTYPELFGKIAGQWKNSFSISNEKILELLIEREQESSTAITSFLAIPHIIIDGEKQFKMIIIRSHQGIDFGPGHEKIKAIFVLAGTKDERQFHLQSLSAIAQITQSRNFEKMWLAAKNENSLKDICLLSERKRIK